MCTGFFSRDNILKKHTTMLTGTLARLLPEEYLIQICKSVSTFFVNFWLFRDLSAKVFTSSSFKPKF